MGHGGSLASGSAGRHATEPGARRAAATISRMGDDADERAPGVAPALPGGEVAPRRQLDRAPAARYDRPGRAAGNATDAAAGSSRRSSWLVVAVAIAIVGAGAIALVGGVLAVDVGLLVIAPPLGWAIGLAVRRTADGEDGRRGRRTVSALLATAAVVGGFVLTWRYALSEGGVLGLVDYLAQVFGVLVVLEIALAALAAWWAAR